ncbi:MAG: vanadium-dependent haloperoxidase [Kineosporiaceae bacterium]
MPSLLEATALWRPPAPFADLQDTAYPAVEAARLVELYGSAIETLVTGQLEAGDAAAAAATAQTRLPEDPYEHIDAWAAARLFGLLNMGMADGYVASFDTKYHDAFWRPVTAIRAAGNNGNDATSPDPTWTTLRPTPPIPDYDSGHAVQGGVAAAVLRGFFGTDRISFTACSRTLPAADSCTDATPVVRHYTRLSQAAEENGISRILIGFHLRTAVQAGIHHGTRIGSHAVEHYLRPVH